MRKIFLLFVLISSYTFSQSINDYQYVFVPAKFSDFKENDKFRLNTNVKLLLQKYGFKAYLPTDSIPYEVANAGCNKLYADLVKDNGLLDTRVKIVLKDCKDKVIFETAFGKSKEKEFAVSYNLALRAAGKSFETLHYKYNGNFDVEIVNLPGTEPGAIAPDPPAPTKGGSETTELIYGSPEGENSNSKVFFFAQPIANGYQVVDNEPKVIMKLFNTSQKNMFIAEKGDKKGVVLQKLNQWFFEYSENGKIFSEPLNLKF